MGIAERARAEGKLAQPMCAVTRRTGAPLGAPAPGLDWKASPFMRDRISHNCLQLTRFQAGSCRGR